VGVVGAFVEGVVGAVVEAVARSVSRSGDDSSPFMHSPFVLLNLPHITALETSK
jgi:hypothetical protein